MNGFKVCLGLKSHCDISDNAVRRMLSASIGEKQILIKKNQVREFFNMIGQKGYPFCPSTFTENHCRADTFEQTQLFVLTFDYRNTFNQKHNPNLSFCDIKERTERHNLPIVFAATIPSTFDLTPDERVFYIVFLSDAPITSLREAETIQKALLTIFPEANRQHSSVIDLYFGGNKVLHYDETMPTINPDITILSLYLYLRDQYGSNYRRKISSFAEDTGILLDDKNRPVVSFAEKLMDNSGFDKYFDENPVRISHQKSDKNSPKPIIYGKDLGEKLSRLNFTIHFQDDLYQKESDQSSTVNRSKVHQLYRSDTIKAISFNCELYHEFESINSGREVSYQELLGIASNLTHVESGKKAFVRILKSRSSGENDELTISDWEHCFHYLNRRKPYPCSSFCPYHATCTHGQNILSTCSIKPSQIERVSNNENQLVSLDEAYADFKKCFNSAVESGENVWHVIKSQTALGKTQAVLQLLKDHPEMKVLLVVPTNILKREIVKRAKEMGTSLVVSPSLHELSDDLSEDVWEDIANLLDSGRSPIPRINRAIKNGKGRDAKLFKQYLSERDTFYSSDGCAVTTHRRLKCTPSQGQTESMP